MPNPSHLELLTTQQPTQWKEVLDEIGTYEFYHLPEFHRLSEIRGEGTAIMPVFREDNTVIAFPMMIRDIKLPETVYDGEPLRDATSVGGFVGPVASSPTVPASILQHYQESLKNFFQQRQIITVYHRLNPLFDQTQLLEGFGKLTDIGVTLSIDLTIPLEEQIARYGKSVRRDVRIMKEKGLTCEDGGAEYLEDFLRIYYSTMERVGADKVYFFDRAFFEYLMNDMSDVIHVFVCKSGDKVISASLCAFCNGIIEGYLGGTDPDYLSISPSKLVYDFSREWGTRAGAKMLHLGGGVRAQKDSLYAFKMEFGPREYTYNTWQYVADRKIYDELCQAVCKHTGYTPDDSYFPKYRHPKLQLFE